MTHAQASNVSPPTQANNTTLQQPAEHAYTSRNQQTTYQATALASNQYPSHTARHNTDHLCGSNGQA